MTLKTASLLACIGSSITIIMQAYSFIRFNLIERTEYHRIEGDIFSIISLISNIFLLIFFLTYYNKQNNTTWKD